jgi:hypothetical protein
MRGGTGGYPYYQWQAGNRQYTFAQNKSTGAQGIYLVSGSIDKINSYNHRVFGVDDQQSSRYADGLSMRFSGNAVWSHWTTAQPTLEIISEDRTGGITGQHISGSAQTTASFGRVNAITGFFEAGSKISDYVFEDSYNLRTLDEVETYISQSKHLPGIPSEANIQEWRNLSMGDKDRLLLEKIEELTLYTIQLNKRIKELENQ